jgi:hypothetical protein
MNNYLQSLLGDIKNSRDNSSQIELPKKLKPGEFLFEIFEYEEPGTGSFKNRTPSVDKRVQGLTILDFQPPGNAVQMLKSVWKSEDEKPKFVVLDRLIIDEDLVEFLQKQTSLGALFLINCQMDNRSLDLSKNSFLKELYILSNEGIQGAIITPPSQVKTFVAHLVAGGPKECIIDIESCEDLEWW